MGTANRNSADGAATRRPGSIRRACYEESGAGDSAPRDRRTDREPRRAPSTKGASVSRRDDGASYREEIIGWLGVVIFTFSVWRLREWLNRSTDDGYGYPGCAELAHCTGPAGRSRAYCRAQIRFP